MLEDTRSGFLVWPHRPPSFEARRDLPLQPKAIIGREHLLTEIRRRLLRPEVRLLTLTGPPGVGKTRLAWALADNIRDEFASGVRFVNLAPIGEARQVVFVVARELGVSDTDDRIVVEVVEKFLRDKALLLILDNFEHVLDAADVVARLLGACPGLKVLATSRAPLHLRWERELAVPSLELPDLHGSPNADAVAASPAGQLFVERAQAVQPDFVVSDLDAAAVAEICAHVDGLPLAIELAAARIKLFPPRALLRRLVRAQQGGTSQSLRLHLLANEAPDLSPRQQTLRGAINWSYDLLDAREQAAFRRFCVFVGGCSVEAAEAVCGIGMNDGLEALASLVDKNLVIQEQQQPDGEPRLRMLETIREYASELLWASDEAEAVRARHAAYYLDLVERAAPQFVGPRQQAWFEILERERDNLQAVERWAIARGGADFSARLWAALWPIWLARDDAFASRERLDAFLPVLREAEATPALAGALHGAGLIAGRLGDFTMCRALLEQALALARQLGDQRMLPDVLYSLGRQLFIEGHHVESRTLLEESQAILHTTHDRVGLARVLSGLGYLEFLEGRPAAARAVYEQGLALARAAQDHHRVAEFMDNLGQASVAEGDFETAARLFEQAIAMWRQLGQAPWLAMALNNLGMVLIRRGEPASARRHLLEALSLSHRMGNRRRSAYTLTAVAALAEAEGQVERARTLNAIASATVAEIGAAPWPDRLRVQPAHAAPSAGDGTAGPIPAMTLDRAIEDSLAWLASPGGPAASGQPVANARSAAAMPNATASPRTDGLTRRELDVVALLAQGFTNRQVGEALVLTEGTVENYVQRILSKLGFKSRAQIAVWAVEHGVAPLARSD